MITAGLLWGGTLGAQSIPGYFEGGTGEILPLEGPWLFYRDQLLTPGILSQGVNPEVHSIPGVWSFKDSPHPSWGHGTYVVTVAWPGLESPVLHMPNAGSSLRLFVNGRELFRAGTVGTQESEWSGSWKPGLVWLPESPEGRWELVIQVSNYGDIFGGFNAAPRLGNARIMTDENRRQLIQEAFFFGALLLISFYHLGLFFFRMKDPSPLWFGLVALVLSTRILVDNQLMLLQLYPDLSWVLALKWNYLTLSLSVLLFPQFMASVFPDHSWKISLRGVQGAAVIYSLMVIFFPTGVFTQFLSAFHVVTMLGGIYIFAVLFRALGAGAPGSKIFLAGFLFFFLTVVHDVVKIYVLTPLPPLVPSGLLIFLLFQALVMARKFTAAFTAAENFGQYLKKMNMSLERFIPREVLAYLKKDSIMDINLGDHTEKEMTILFSDIRGFTALSEKMTPRENFNFINSYLNRMGPIIRMHGGFVDKYLGDGIMALFPGDPKQALDAALAMRAELVKYNADRAKAGYEPIRIGMGLHTGHLMVGTIGEEGRMDSTVISDAVNLASRLEGLTKVFPHDILFSREVYEKLSEEDRISALYLGTETVKGKTASIDVYTLSAGPGNA